MIEKVHGGSAGTAWLARCHRHGPPCDPHNCTRKGEHEHVMSLERASRLMDESRIDGRANVLVFFGTDAFYEAAKTHWTEGAAE